MSTSEAKYECACAKHRVTRFSQIICAVCGGMSGNVRDKFEILEEDIFYRAAFVSRIFKCRNIYGVPGGISRQPAGRKKADHWREPGD